MYKVIGYYLIKCNYFKNKYIKLCYVTLEKL